ncbi:MAG: ATP-binding protein [Actinomycetota bacterium]
MLRNWSDAPLRVKGLIVVALPVVALGVAVAAAAVADSAEDGAVRAVEHTLEVQRELRRTSDLLSSGETSVRGYLLTREPRYLAPFETADSLLAGSLERLTPLVEDHPDQAERAETLRVLTEQRMDLLQTALNLAQSRALGDDELRRLLEEGRRLQIRVRALLDEMESIEAGFLADGRQAASDAQSFATRAAGGGLLIGVLGGVLAALLFARGIGARIERLDENARRLDRRRPQLPLPPGRDEIGRLGATLAESARLLDERERELGEARRFLEALIERSPVAILRRDEESGITFASSNVERILGYPPEQIVHEPDFWEDNLHPDDRFEELVPGDGPQTIRFKHADGSYRWIEILVRTEDDGGSEAGLLCFALDVTERRATRRALAERESTLSAVVDTSPDVVAIVGSDGSQRYASPSLERILGYRPDRFLGGPNDPTHPDDVRLASELVRGALSSADPVTARFRIRNAAGRWIWMDVRAARFEGREDGEGREGAEVLLSGRDITGQVALEEQLRRAKEEAEGSNRAKSEFLSRMSHELRTPLNAVLGFAQLLELHDLEPDEAEGVREILRGGRHLLDLINEILDISRIETGRLSLSLEPVPVQVVVSESVALVRLLAAQRKIEIISPPVVDTSWHVMADRQRLKQVLLNLLSNAVKYNRSRGRVWVSLDTSVAGRVRIDVSDSGSGIPEDKMDLLFSPFERLGAERSQVEGTGLGLALSKRLVETMGGIIEVRSKPGVGSKFTVDLLQCEGPVERARRSAAGLGREAALEGTTILYVEDNLSNLKLVEHLVAQRPGITLHAAMQGRIGLDIVSEHQPDLVLLDLDLPDMTGAEVLRRLQNDPSTRDVPVVVISADATRGQMDRLLGAGARDYLTKPLDVQRFLGVLEEVLGRPSGLRSGSGR